MTETDPSLQRTKEVIFVTYEDKSISVTIEKSPIIPFNNWWWCFVCRNYCPLRSNYFSAYFSDCSTCSCFTPDIIYSDKLPHDNWTLYQLTCKYPNNDDEDFVVYFSSDRIVNLMKVKPKRIFKIFDIISECARRDIDLPLSMDQDTDPFTLISWLYDGVGESAQMNSFELASCTCDWEMRRFHTFYSVRIRNHMPMKESHQAVR